MTRNARFVHRYCTTGSEWERQCGREPMTNTMFGKQMSERFGHRLTNVGKLYKGLHPKQL